VVVIDPAERGDIPSLRAQGFDFYLMRVPLADRRRAE
jgi:hypothetical protein